MQKNEDPDHPWKEGGHDSVEHPTKLTRPQMMLTVRYFVLCWWRAAMVHVGDPHVKDLPAEPVP